jgi:FkbM family methyltransferase
MYVHLLKMLIPPKDVVELLHQVGISITGALHIGAHDCEELPFYISLGLRANDVVWIDALQNKVDEARARNIPNVHQAVITNKDNDTVEFNVSNNVQSSSIFEFGTHAAHHPHVHYVNKTTLTTTTIDTFMTANALNAAKYNFWNFDIQGAELLALEGAHASIVGVDAMYLEVNTEEVYKGCGKIEQIDNFLGSKGFIRIKTDITPYGWGDALYIKK